MVQSNRANGTFDTTGKERSLHYQLQLHSYGLNFPLENVKGTAKEATNVRAWLLPLPKGPVEVPRCT